MAPANAESALSHLVWSGRNGTAKVWSLCREGMQSALNGVLRLTVKPALTQVSSGLKRPMPACESAGALVKPSATFSKRPHNKIGFSFAWVCECGSFAVLRSDSSADEGEVERKCPACEETQRLAYCRLLCEPRNDMPAAPGKWVYPEVITGSGETAGRDYDWSHYDPIYFQGDRDPDATSTALAVRS